MPYDKLSPESRELTRCFLGERDRLNGELAQLDKLARSAARAVRADGLTLREAGALFGMSHSAVDVMAKEGSSSPRPWKGKRLPQVPPERDGSCPSRNRNTPKVQYSQEEASDQPLRDPGFQFLRRPVALYDYTDPTWFEVRDNLSVEERLRLILKLVRVGTEGSDGTFSAFPLIDTAAQLELDGCGSDSVRTELERRCAQAQHLLRSGEVDAKRVQAAQLQQHLQTYARTAVSAHKHGRDFDGEKARRLLVERFPGLSSIAPGEFDKLLQRLEQGVHCQVGVGVRTARRGHLLKTDELAEFSARAMGVEHNSPAAATKQLKRQRDKVESALGISDKSRRENQGPERAKNSIAAPDGQGPANWSSEDAAIEHGDPAAKAAAVAQ